MVFQTRPKHLSQCLGRQVFESNVTFRIGISLKQDLLYKIICFEKKQETTERIKMYGSQYTEVKYTAK